ncbi:PSD1 and planctomycete cytochrome C domain-containing protein [Rhodopirellula baltica]|uniref:PSD1 and planctomycete cytochrome C domain-containing protein n=1 Tax=Rhodopirellula baltica TaxID=265606 RepID=UPI000569381F|nr:PSD1 and planctomycete cytochrome C domain-containing protein [Rhodopirellula baltica]
MFFCFGKGFPTRVGLLTLAWVMFISTNAIAIDFNRDVRPILSENCFHCHGPDAESREADLRLDTQTGSRRELSGSPAVVPNEPDQSGLIERIFSDDPDSLMPPPESKRKLSAHQKSILKSWIAEGGDYEQHWAFIAPTQPSVPGIDQATSSSHPVDRFIWNRLHERGLEPSRAADRRTLIRRVSLDLTGLPPTPEQVNSFVHDSDLNAYERLVDRLLASEQFGERWARPWLDLARYADSNGFQADQLRDSWAYRDWVINALNDDMPFDQFTIEQLAGDLLPNATIDQKIASGFHRTVPCNVEAGVHPEENRVNQVIDRVNATATAWLGMTIECAQCHDHKYDPVSQKEYYKLFAFFNNTPMEVENPSGKGVSFDFWGPKMDLPLPPDQASNRSRLQAEIASLEAKRNAVLEAGDFENWTQQLSIALDNQPEFKTLSIASVSSTGDEEMKILDDQSVLFTGKLPDKTVYEIHCDEIPADVIGWKIEALTHPSLPGTGPGRGDAVRSNFILSEFEVEIVSKEGSPTQRLDLHSASADYSQPAWNVANAIDGDLKTGWAIASKFQQSHWAQFLLQTPLRQSEDSTLRFRLEQRYGRGRTIGRVRLSALCGNPLAINVPEQVAKAAKKPAKDRSPSDFATLESHFEKTNPKARALQRKIQKLTKQLESTQPATTLVMVEMEEPRETFVMQRGNYLSPGDRVSPGTPMALHQMNGDLPMNRLGLARWLVDPANPLTARVTVNRWWAQLFGQGIVDTLEDFGTQSSPPTHPDLLDWLAVELVESGWSMKHVLKTIVMSETYQQDSKVRADLIEADPANKWYARGPRFRMSAEMIRDNALAVSGLLSAKMHGPPIMPHQPTGIWRQVGRNEPKWIAATDQDRYRRGVYVVWRRAAPYPSFVNFDGPDRSSCVVGRPRTNTPLQALTLLNDPAYVEMALALANRILCEHPDGSDSDRLSAAFEIVLSRRPAPQESARLMTFLDERKQHIHSNPQLARSLVQEQSFPNHTVYPSTEELGAWFYVANVLLNLDETITKD